MTDERTNAPPRAETQRLWTVAELAAAVARALSRDYEGAGSGRVTDVPGVRVIRWYQTIGLVDRPAEMRGRTALYGPRHLRQIVAIKRLQSAGQSLAEIQEALVGAPEEVLERVARVPEGELFAGEARALDGPAAEGAVLVEGAVPAAGAALAGSPAPAPVAELVDAAALPVTVEVEDAPAEPPRGRFWASRAVSPVVAGPASTEAAPDTATFDTGPVDTATPDTASFGGAAPRAATSPVVPELSYGIAVAPGVTVLVSLPRSPDPAAIAAIRAASAPLVAELAAHRAAAVPPGPKPAVPASADPTTDSATTAPSTTAPSTTTHAPAARGLTEGASS
ncbi:helix-turn-helix domain-containing protein [Phytomonospora endophytica]|uniref:HTH merR-type domain-containing protein n=1 Tax=Phytomonospora endophytica TaxID=714109 RepID=A0A841FFS3_9ACTN|nr:helix-turn-helix domain-containing protein [Phytomonospora endophytica]MBB6032688.1 hypothetical protein [Phytomonospora endophytica]GIG66162.1 hypothetical protein Pen01_24570 [Phytomonospora endophytica]